MPRIFNTFTMDKEELPKPSGQDVRVFVCGPTVYDYAHLGHARTYLSLDMIIRYLRFRGYRPYVVMNITDIDERIIEKSKDKGKDFFQLASEFEKLFLEDMATLGISTIDRFERVTNHIPDIISQVQELIGKGYAYETETGVYFDVSKSPSYGQLSGQTKADLKLRRLELCSTKHHPEDFSLWRKFDDEPLWGSPWGKGRPGWHIEDTAISMKYLGSSYDIHVGGAELVFPHHEAEIAQGEALSGKRPFVKYWVHTGMLDISGIKMSKSLGNVVTVRDALAKYTPEELRFVLASTHYRRTASYSRRQLLKGKSKLQAMREAASKLGACSSRSGAGKFDMGLLKELFRTETAFISAMDDDFDTPRALKALYRFLQKTKNQVRSGNELNADTCATVLKRVSVLANIIGLTIS